MDLGRPRTILITGVAGFIGSWLAQELVTRGHSVLGTVRNDPAADGPFARLNLGSSVELRPGVSERTAIEQLLSSARVDIVFNLAGQSQVQHARADPVEAFEANTRSVWVLLEAVRRTERTINVVQASTDGVYGETATGRDATEQDAPDCDGIYEASKAAADLVALSFAGSYGMPVCVARMGNVFGPGDANHLRIVPSVMQAVWRGDRPRLRAGGRAVRSFLFVDDAVDGLILLAANADKGARGEIINLCGHPPVTMLEMTRAVLDAMGETGLEPEITEGTSDEISVKRSSAEKARTLLGWQPKVTLPEGLRRVVAWSGHRAAKAEDG